MLRANTFAAATRDEVQLRTRFYSLQVECDLFGRGLLRGQWGRIATAGRTRLETQEGERASSAALERIEAAKRRKGYAVA